MKPLPTTVPKCTYYLASPSHRLPVLSHVLIESPREADRVVITATFLMSKTEVLKRPCDLLKAKTLAQLPGCFRREHRAAARNSHTTAAQTCPKYFHSHLSIQSRPALPSHNHSASRKQSIPILKMTRGNPNYSHLSKVA